MSYTTYTSYGSLGMFQPGLALDYMNEVNNEITQLNNDIMAQTAPGAPPNMVGQYLLGPWNSFLNDPNPQDDDVPLKGWTTWYHNNSSLWNRSIHTDYILQRTAEYQRTYVDFYNLFHDLGGAPTQALPKTPGQPSQEILQKEQEERAAEPGIYDVIKYGIVVSAVTVAGYFFLTSQVPRVFEKAFESKKAKARR